MQMNKIAKAELELDNVSCELQTMRNLLNVFTNWFDETHKTYELDRTCSENEMYRLWREAPTYESVLCALFSSISSLEKEINVVIDDSLKEHIA